MIKIQKYRICKQNLSQCLLTSQPFQWSSTMFPGKMICSIINTSLRRFRSDQKAKQNPLRNQRRRKLIQG